VEKQAAMTATMVARKVLGVAAAAGVASTPVASVVYNADLHRKCSGFLSLSSSSSVVPGLGLGLELRRWRRRKWTSTSSRRRSENGGVVAMVAVPFRPLTLPTEEPGAAEDDDDEKREFDPSAIPPFTLADIRAAIPKHCWEKNVWKSMSFVARDVAIVFGLAAGAAYLNTWFVWPLYWLAQGTMFWALFVLGHDWCAVLSEPPSFCCFPLASFLPSFLPRLDCIVVFKKKIHHHHHHPCSGPPSCKMSELRID
jgi:hypothetical protein